MGSKPKKTDRAYCYFIIEGHAAPEIRNFNFNYHEARQAFLRFMSWAVANKITVVITDEMPNQEFLDYMRSVPAARFDHLPSSDFVYPRT